MSRESFNYDTPLSCDNNHQNLVAVLFDTFELIVLAPKPVSRANSTLLKPKHVQSATTPNSYCTRSWNFLRPT